MAQLEKCLFCKVEDLSLYSQNPSKNCKVWWHAPVILRLEKGKGGGGTFELASQTAQVIKVQ